MLSVSDVENMFLKNSSKWLITINYAFNNPLLLDGNDVPRNVSLKFLIKASFLCRFMMK